MPPAQVHMEEVMRAISRGDKMAFEELFREWYVRLCLYAESIIKDRDMAEDLVQNIFCSLWEKRQGLHIRESVKSYLYRSVYNATLNALKHEKVKLAFLKFLQKHSKNEESSEYWEDEKRQSTIVQEIDQAVENLPGQCREIFILSRFAGKKSYEIAESLHISVRTVETQLYRAMKRLRDDLAHLKKSEIFFIVFLKNVVSIF